MAFSTDLSMEKLPSFWRGSFIPNVSFGTGYESCPPFFEGKQGFKCVFPSRAWEQRKCKIREMFLYEIKGLTGSNISKQWWENNDHNRCPNCINRNIIGLPFLKR